MARPRAVDGATALMAPPPAGGGRTYRGRRRVRLSDVWPDGEARLDTVARWLQDVAADDATDAGADAAYRWVVRRSALEVRRRPAYGEGVEAVTWCSGTGAAWAERRTTLTGPTGALLDAVSLWVSLEPATMRPCPLGEPFFSAYGTAAGARAVRARLLHDPSPPPAAARAARSWPLRDADIDVLDHVNNAVAWAVVEEEARRRAPDLRIGWVEVEYRAPVAAGAELRVASLAAGAELRVWVVGSSGEAAITGVVRAAPPAPAVG